MLRKTDGNALIILISRNEEVDASFLAKEDHLMSVYEKYLYDPELIKKLAGKGLQPSMDVLAKNMMVS